MRNSVSPYFQISGNAWIMGYRGDSIEELEKNFQPKTEWEVEFDENGKLKLVK